MNLQHSCYFLRRCRQSLKSPLQPQKEIVSPAKKRLFLTEEPFSKYYLSVESDSTAAGSTARGSATTARGGASTARGRAIVSGSASTKEKGGSRKSDNSDNTFHNLAG